MSFLKKLFGRRPELMDWRQFTEHYAQAARRELGVEAEIEWGSDIEESSVIITLPNGTQGNCYMGNHYARYRQAPDDLDEIIRQSLLPVAHMAGDIDDTARPDNIIPVIKNTGYLHHLQEVHRQDGKDPDESLYYRPLAGDLVLMYMVDCDESMRGFHRGDLADLNLSDEALHERALDNLRTLAENLQLIRSESTGLCQLVLDGTYDASLLLLLEDILAAADISVPGDTVLAVPARDTLLFCGSEDAAALAQMREHAQQVIQEAPHPISTQLYVYRQGKLALFQAN